MKRITYLILVLAVSLIVTGPVFSQEEDLSLAGLGGDIALGKITEIDLENSTITISAMDGSRMSFSVNRETTPIVRGEDIIHIEDLDKDQSVEIESHMEGDKRVADFIDASDYLSDVFLPELDVELDAEIDAELDAELNEELNTEELDEFIKGLELDRELERPE